MEDKKIDYKDVIKKEYIRCAKDPIYFLKKYVHIQTTEKGRQLFSLFVFQEKVLHLISKNSRTILLKSRQLGLTTLIAGYALWMMLFQPDSKIMALAPTQDKAINILDKVKFGYNNLPSWLITGDTESEKMSEKKFKLKNGSEMQALTGASDAARGFTGNLLIIDEAAFIDNAEAVWGSSQQTLATGGSAIILSTPNGHGNFFHKTWMKAENNENDFLPIRLPWNLHPDRDQKWRNKQDVELGEKLASQECDCDFIASGDGYFTLEDKQFVENNIEEPKEKRGERESYWIWKYPDPTRTYFAIADVSRGDGADSNALEILDLETLEQVAELKDNHMGTKEFSKFIVTECMNYNNAFLIIENTGLGWSVVSDVVDIGYENIYYSPRSSTMDFQEFIDKQKDIVKDGLVAGHKTTTSNRPQIINSLGIKVRSRDWKIRSKRVYKEMETFIWKNGKPMAMRGYNDDLLLSLGIGFYLKETVLEFKEKGLLLTRTVLSSIKRVNSHNIVRNSMPNNLPDPYKMNVMGVDEDLRWLLNN